VKFVSELKTFSITLTVGLGLIALMTFLWPWTPMELRSDLNAEVAARTALQVMFGRLVEVVELQAVISSEDPDSPEFKDARAQLRRLRRVRITSDPDKK
jgi:hypothetical protein